MSHSFRAARLEQQIEKENKCELKQAHSFTQTWPGAFILSPLILQFVVRNICCIFQHSERIGGFGWACKCKRYILQIVAERPVVFFFHPISSSSSFVNPMNFTGFVIDLKKTKDLMKALRRPLLSFTKESGLETTSRVRAALNISLIPPSLQVRSQSCRTAVWVLPAP